MPMVGQSSIAGVLIATEVKLEEENLEHENFVKLEGDVTGGAQTSSTTGVINVLGIPVTITINTEVRDVNGARVSPLVVSEDAHIPQHEYSDMVSKTLWVGGLPTV